MSEQLSNDFIRVLSEMRGGLVQLDLSKKQAELVEACQKSGKKGVLNVSITYDPTGSQNVEFRVSAKATIKKPAEPDLEERSTFFAERGQLHRHDPRQREQRRGPVGVDRDDRRTGTED